MESAGSEGYEQVRLAMALNGGVSLAVWMGGCAVELDSARRGHLGPELLSPGSERSVYSGICHATRKRLVIDVMSGSSAGGINAALLAAATTRRRRLHPDFVRASWLDLGDLGTLLHHPSNPEPRSLMQGNLFHDALKRTFRSVLGEPAGPSESAGAELNRLPLSQQRLDQGTLDDGVPRVDITTTDIAGRPVRLKDEWNLTLAAREHRVKFRFRDEADYSPSRLADAARSSASFPLAFEPWLVSRDSAAITVKGEVGGPKPGAMPFWAVDGGLLDNAPIRAALDLIPGQLADGRVTRMLCYVNGDPHGPEPELGEVGVAPDLKEVIGLTMSLPRTAPFVDHVFALEHALQPSGTVASTVEPLLAVDIGTLETVSRSLYRAYRNRRARASIVEMFSRSRTPLEVRMLTDRAEVLPWLPLDYPSATSFNADETLVVEWKLGLRPAQRALHLLVDMIRRVELPAPPGEFPDGDLPGLTDLLAAKREITALAAGLDEEQDAVLNDRELFDALASRIASSGPLHEAFAPYARRAMWALWQGFTEFERVAGLIASRAEIRGDSLTASAAQTLMGNVANGIRPFGNFLRHAFAIEVIRRAYSDGPPIETGQGIRFAQLTPEAPTPILHPNPLSPSDPPGAEGKLTGIRLGHFAAFYRRSWRANDFMWGRLDAATRIVEVMIGPNAEAGQLPADAAANLAWTVLPANATSAQLWLVEEAMRPFVGDEWTPLPEGGTAATPELRDRLEAEMELEFRSGRTELARRVCSRAAQLEILEAELPVLVSESAGDLELGAASRALPEALGDTTNLRAAIEHLREIENLPAQLGRDDPREAVSDLAAGTIARSVYVGVSAVRAAKLPLSGALNVLRPWLYSVSGIVSHRAAHRAAAGLGFMAAAFYLTSRTLSTDEALTAIPLDNPISWEVLVPLVALLTITGTAFIPGMRAAADSYRPRNSVLFAVLLLASGLPAVVAVLLNGLPVAGVVLAPGANEPPDVVLAMVLALGFGLFVAAFPQVLNPLRSQAERIWTGWPTLAALLIVAVLVIVFSAVTIVESLADGPWWRTACCLLTLVLAPVAAINLAVGQDRRPKTLPSIDGVAFSDAKYFADTDRLRLRTTDWKYGDPTEQLANGHLVSFTLDRGITSLTIAGVAAALQSDIAVSVETGVGELVVEPRILRQGLELAKTPAWVRR